jgi:hypothetical protein
MAGLIVRRPNGSVLLDTQYIVHGLVKSAYLVADETWPRKYLRSSQLDPNQGSSYDDSSRAGDQMFSITIPNVNSPFCFITGKGCLQGSTRTGNTIKFYYSGASTSTKAYVYDLMGDLAGSPPYMKTRNSSGAVTFNSLQVPLNVAFSIQAPAPASTDQFGRYLSPYAGGNWQLIRAQTASVDPVAHFVVDVALVAGREYAVFLNFSRGTTGYWASEMTGVNAQAVGMSEGAYGRVGGISFMFGPAGATTDISISSNSYSIPGSVSGLPTDRYPTALVVETTILPFPYN